MLIGGPIQHAFPHGQSAGALREVIDRVAGVVSDARGDVFSAHRTEEFGESATEFSPEDVTERDFNWMQRCDVFVPILPSNRTDSIMRTDGTHVELGWASALGKPIVVLTDSGVVHHGSHLLRGLHTIATVSFLDIDDVMVKPQTLLEMLDDVHSAPTRP
ncbi:nucleoside 2-deoxyribosyltransferase [Dactylosporangium roseum]|uniref:nucleoside 2-deoxyribosyltransferase n=1 Tax=Dactylosporangium roseum TaxID=47989 RepID=UPI0021B412FD|nr:nucleoside 2-deoxyribosyltransferase [Dactylosporangium roseum]